MCDAGGGAPGGGGPGVGGSGGGFECAPGEERDCYEGPAGTENVGTCIGGTQTCQSTKQWGDCVGQVLPTTDLCISPEDEDCDDQPPDCPSAWQVIIGDAGTGGGGTEIAISPDDSVVVVGFFSGEMTLDGQVYTAPATGDAYVVKITPTGEIDWVQFITGLGNQTPLSVAVGPAGEVVVGGYFFSEADFGLGQPVQATGIVDGFLWGLDADGTPQWVETIGGSAGQGDSRITDVAIDAGGNVAIVGYYSGLTDFAGEELPDAGTAIRGLVARLDSSQSMSFHKVIPDVWARNIAFQSNGDLIASFVKPPAAVMDLGGGPILEEGFIGNFGVDGDLVWGFPFGSPTAATPQIGYGILGGLVTLADDRVFFHLTGYGQNGFDLGGGVLPPGGMFELSLAGDGAYAESGVLGTFMQITSLATAAAPDGSALFGGYFAGGSSFTVAGQTYTMDGPDNADSFIVRVGTDGALVDARTFGTAGSTVSIQSLGVDSSGSVVLMATWAGDGIDLGLGPLPLNGGGQTVVARVDW